MITFDCVYTPTWFWTHEVCFSSYNGGWIFPEHIEESTLYTNVFQLFKDIVFCVCVHMCVTQNPFLPQTHFFALLNSSIQILKSLYVSTDFSICLEPCLINTSCSPSFISPISHHSTNVALTKVNNNFHTAVSEGQLPFT